MVFLTQIPRRMKNYLLKRTPFFVCVCILSVLFLMPVRKAKASHIVGGEVTWKCVVEGGVSKYQFKLVIYRDCWKGFDQGANQTLNALGLNGVFDPVRNAGRISNPTSIRMTRSILVDIAPPCDFPAGSLPLSCTNKDPGTVEKSVYYSDPIDFYGIEPPTDPNSPYAFYWETCCRNGSINNGFDNDGVAFVSKMYPYYPNGSTTARPVDQCFDNSPDFSESPASLFYTSGIDFVFNNNAIDMDLDELYYEQEDPIINSDYIITRQDPAELWANYPEYNKNNPFGLAPDQHYFDNNTGEYTFKPINAGFYVYAVKVVSKKCDQIVSEVFRDLQVINLTPTIEQSTNRFPTLYKPFNNNTSNYMSVTAGDTIKFPIIVRDSLPTAGAGLSPQDINITVNGMAMGALNASTTVGCPYPPCAVISKVEKFDYDVDPTLEKSIPIENTPGEVFGLGYELGASYDDTVWFYWPTQCSNLAKVDNCNGLTSSLYNFVVTTQDNFCSVPGKTIRTFAINVLPPDFYRSPPIHCITYDYTTGWVSLDWTTSTGDPKTFKWYEIFRDNISIDTLFDISTFSYIDSIPGATDNSVYYVRSVNNCGLNDEVFPVSPIKLEAVFHRSNQARILWNPIRTPGLASQGNYRVYRSSTLNPPTWVEITDADGNLTNTSAIDNYNLCGDTTLYKVEQEDDLGCVSISNIDTIIHPELLARVSSDTVCFGEPTVFHIDTLGGGISPYSTVRWLGTDGMSGGHLDTLVYTFPSPGMKYYTFTVIDSKGCRIDINDSIYVRPLPDFEIVQQPICPDRPVNFEVNINSTVPIITYAWEGDFDGMGNPNFISDQPNPVWVFFTDGGEGPGRGRFPITLTLTDLNGCIKTVYDTVETGDPYIDILTDNSECLNPQTDSIRIEPFFLPKPYTTVQWFDDATGELVYDLGDILPVSVLAGRRYIDLRVKIETSVGCSGEGVKSFQISPAFEFSADSVCVGDPIKFELDFAHRSDTANFSYLWELTESDISTDRRPLFTYITAGPKEIFLTVTDNINGCKTFYRDTFEVKYPLQFSVGLIPACAGEEVLFFPDMVPGVPGNDTAWRWSINEYPDLTPNNTIYSNERTPSFIFPATDGYYRIILDVNDANTGCWTTRDTIIKVLNQPDITFDVDSLNCSGKLTKFLSKVIGNSAPYSYEWTGDDNFESVEVNPTHVYPDGTALYEVTLSVTNIHGCVVSLTKNVRVCDDKTTVVKVPDVFTPQAESRNTLQVYVGNVQEYEIRIYNRWGIEVFYSNDPLKSWDGKDASGNFVPVGTYVYVVNASGSGKRNLLTKGTVAVLR